VYSSDVIALSLRVSSLEESNTALIKRGQILEASLLETAQRLRLLEGIYIYIYAYIEYIYLDGSIDIGTCAHARANTRGQSA